MENTKEGITNKLEETKTELINSNLNVPIKAAAEYLVDSKFVTLFQMKHY